MSNRGRGYKPSSVLAHLHPRFKSVHALLATIAFAASSDLSPHAPPVMDQSQTSSCGGHGTSVGVATTCAAKGHPLPFVPSPKGIYDTSRECTCTPSADGSIVLTDDGIDPLSLLTCLAKCGVRPIEAPTSDGRYSDCELATINQKETLAEDEESARELVVGEYAIDPGASNFPQLVAACLSQKVAVGVGIVSRGPFEEWGDNWVPDKAPLDGVANASQADHWVCVIAHRTEADGSLSFLIRNSWGISWGCPDAKNPGGCIWVSARWLQSATAECIAFDVATKEAA